MKKTTVTKEYAVEYIKEQYGTEPEFTWVTHPNYAVFRHSDNKKWFGLMADVEPGTFGLNGKERVFVINLKCDPLMTGSIIKEKGIFRAYHMNKANWISVLLNGTVNPELFRSLLEMSFSSTASNRRKHQTKAGKVEWIVPANPKYFDIVGAFEKDDIIIWKQSSNIRPGDIVYMYVAAPYSAILYKCEAVETDIPYVHRGGKVNIDKVMRIKKLEQYPKDLLTFELLGRYGVRAVRGPRSMPVSLMDDIPFLTGKGDSKDGNI